MALPCCLSGSGDIILNISKHRVLIRWSGVLNLEIPLTMSLSKLLNQWLHECDILLQFFLLLLLRLLRHHFSLHRVRLEAQGIGQGVCRSFVSTLKAPSFFISKIPAIKTKPLLTIISCFCESLTSFTVLSFYLLHHSSLE